MGVLMAAAIVVDGVSKRYRIARSADRLPYRTLRDDLVRWATWPARRLRGEAGPRAEDFWALRDVSFEVQPGERVGIIGRNGAGKSTLLKILSRITRPTAGRVRLRGRVASLLEVGTGFHPELTGRENIYLSGAVQGMKRSEVRRKFDEIVGFAEVEQFLDTPVKRYSSGMYVRLAFAVAAHLEPEVFIIDEVLAVGDAGFQKKCLGKMDEVARGGRTVLFVSHNLQALRALCERGVVLDGGRMQVDAPLEVALPTYLNALRGAAVVSGLGAGNRLNRTSGDVQIEAVDARDITGASRWTYRTGETVRLSFTYRGVRPVPSLGFYLALRSGLTAEVVTTFKESITRTPVLPETEGEVELELPNLPLRPGEYSLYLCLGDAEGERICDVVDENVNLPWLILTSDEADARRTAGVVSLDYRCEVRSGVVQREVAS